LSPLLLCGFDGGFNLTSTGNFTDG